MALFAKKKNDLYQIGTENGMLKGWLDKTSMQKSTAFTVNIKDVPENLISIREAAAFQSLTGGQGLKKCNCKSVGNRCQGNRCKCFKAKRQCTSRCHSNLTCKNK